MLTVGSFVDFSHQRCLGAQLLLEGLRHPLELTLVAEAVRPGSRQRRRVCVERNRWTLSGMEHAVNRARSKREGGSWFDHAADRLAVQAQAVLSDLAAQDADRRARFVVVVEAGVLVLAPADEPGVDILVLPDLLIDAHVAGVAHVRFPEFRGGGEPLDKGAELFRGQAHARASDRANSEFALAWRSASRPVGTGSATGRSDP